MARGALGLEGRGELSRLVTGAAARSWASPRPSRRPPGAEVFLVGRAPAGGGALGLRGDVDLGYRHAALRVLNLWHYLATHHSGSCSWFAMADADTLLNLWAVGERLRRYFRPSRRHYLGVPKVAQGPQTRLRFAQNVAVLSRALLREAAPWLRACAAELTSRGLGRGHGDVALASCLRRRGGVPVRRLGAGSEVPREPGDGYCWQGQFSWLSCCDPSVWGPAGNGLCWDASFETLKPLTLVLVEMSYAVHLRITRLN
ncbi:unnamed protein product [Prorocentrum cordatum]|uniref:Hexosyltransferase n=1 Tax=Prorocentrum cordatum TaxID=2364126 RepID=A0ABN9UW14_9DINO|nr:unnamed protein product [Polarella glacialis]